MWVAARKGENSRPRAAAHLTPSLQSLWWSVLQSMHGMTMPEAPDNESPSRTINVRLPMALYQQLASLAKATARTKSFVTVEA